jgi:hypothetical protein
MKNKKLVFLFEPSFKIKILLVPSEMVKIYQQDMVLHDVDNDETWLHWYYLGEFE